MSDKIVSENFITGEIREHPSLKVACGYLSLRYESLKCYFSRTKARVWLSRDKSLKIQKI